MRGEIGGKWDLLVQMIDGKYKSACIHLCKISAPAAQPNVRHGKWKRRRDWQSCSSSSRLSICTTVNYERADTNLWCNPNWHTCEHFRQIIKLISRNHIFGLIGKKWKIWKSTDVEIRNVCGSARGKRRQKRLKRLGSTISSEWWWFKWKRLTSAISRREQHCHQNSIELN